MTTKLNPYVGFGDNAREAMSFYHSVLGGELTFSTFGESGMSDDPAEAEKIMHAQLLADGGMTLMAADTPPGMDHHGTGSGISISLSGENEAELRGYWDGLSAGGSVVMPFEKAPWGDIFGMFIDKFGINWMVNAVASQG